MKISALLTVLIACSQLSAILLLFVPPSEAADKQIRKRPTVSQNSRAVLESEGLRYVYETTGVDETVRKRHDFYTNPGRITIREAVAGGDIVYQEKFTLRPGCGKFPAISKLPLRSDGGGGSFVVMCGSDEGKHVTIKAFISGPTALDIKTASLDFESSYPSLAYDERHGFYTAKVYKRKLVDGVGYGTKEYPAAYRLLVDDSVFGFVPVFGAPVEQFYFDYYVELRDEVLRSKKAAARATSREDDAIMLSDYFGPMLSALAATENETRICSQMTVFKSFGLNSRDLQTWRKRLANMGYPDFNFDKCAEVTRMSGPKSDVSLSPIQITILKQIVSYGKAKGFSDHQIRIAVKTAYIESRLGRKLGPNPKGSASGLFGYTDDRWDDSYGKKNDNSNQIRAFYDDLSDYSWRYLQ